MNINSEVEVVQLQEKKFVGVAVTSAFANHDPGRVEEAKHVFLNRKDEITEIINPLEYVCLSFTSETLFTYLICMEVTDLKEVPAGMLGFSIPAHKYGKTRSEDDPYAAIHHYLQENGISNNKRAMAIEVYKFEDPQWPNNVDVYIPIEDTAGLG